MSSQDIDWERLDKKKFFVVGVGLFSGVTTLLFPLTVIKTRQMAAHQQVPAGLEGSKTITQQIWRNEGMKGFYRGFGTVVLGTIPARTIYMTSLEVTKSATTKLGEQLNLSPTAAAGFASGAGGAAASLSTQAVVVPVDVVSQRLMMQGAHATTASSHSHADINQPGHRQAPAGTPAATNARTYHTAAYRLSSNTAASSSSSSSSPFIRSQGGRWSPAAAAAGATNWATRCRFSSNAMTQHMGGLQMARLIVQQEGVAGLYRGFWPSVGTFVPNSAIWWGAYGFWQRLLWEQLPVRHHHSSSSSSNGGSGSNRSSSSSSSSTSTAVAVETVAAVLSGCTSAVLTNPLDLVKTRLQVAEPDVSGAVPHFRQVFMELLAEEGLRGLFRGLAPRMASSACWGTAMVSAYNFLKRICAVDSELS